MNRTFRMRSFAAAAALAAAACSPSSVVQVDTPDVATPSSVLTPTGLPALQANTVSEFIFANSGDNGGTDGTIQLTGLFSDEFPISDTFSSRVELDNRSTNDRNDRLAGHYRALHRARRAAEFASDRIRAISLTPTTDLRIPEAQTYAALIYIELAENYCTVQPVSTLQSDGTEVYGAPLTRAQILALAVAKADSAIAYANANAASTAKTRILNFAAIVKARAQLNAAATPADFAAAAATVAAVPASFREVSTHSTTSGRQNNGMMVFNWLSRRYTVADREAASPTETTGTPPAGVGLDFRTAGDPRITSFRGSTFAFDNTAPLFRLGKYPTQLSSIPVADYLEAQLIVAESQLQAGNEAGYIATLNALRANNTLYPGNPFTGTATAPTPVAPSGVLPALVAPSAGVIDAADVDLLFRERAFWLYATGHRLADLRRLMRQYGRTEAQTFPGGGARPYFLETSTLTRVNGRGINYGSQVSFIIPSDEVNNPQWTPAACDPTIP